MKSSQKKQKSGSLDDLVFENRNKEYGAYELRSNYDKTAGKSMVLVVACYVLIIFSVFSFSFRSNPTPDPDPMYPDTTIYIPVKMDPKQSSPAASKGTKGIASKFVRARDTVEQKPNKNIDSVVNEPFNGTAGNPGTGTTPGQGTQGAKGDSSSVGQITAAHPDKPWLMPGLMPEFPGGEAALRKFIIKNFRVNYDGEKENIRMLVKFVVGRDGAVKDIEVLSGYDEYSKKEIIRVIGKMPKWKPGENNGEPVNVLYTLPVKIKLN